jgi:MFS family permease
MESTYPIGWAVAADFFGRTHFAKIRGYMTLIYAWGGVVGPVAAGAIYDRWQTYEPLLWSLIVTCAVSGVFFGVLSRSWERLGVQR